MRLYGCRRFLLHLSHLCQKLLVCHLFSLLLLVFLKQLVDNLAFLQTAMTHSSIDCIPVLETILADNFLHKFRFQQITENDLFRFAVTIQHILTADNILFLEFRLEPLIDLVLGLRTLDNI